MKSDLRKTQVCTSDERYDWLLGAQSYLLSARILASILLESKDYLSTNPFINSGTFKKWGFPPHPGYELVMPVLFNLKHGIELWLKALDIVENGQYTHTHDIKILKANLGEDIAKKLRDIESLIRSYASFDFIPTLAGSVDTENIVFRFPNKQKRMDKLQNVEISLVEKLRDDALTLNDAFRKIYLEATKRARISTERVAPYKRTHARTHESLA